MFIEEEDTKKIMIEKGSLLTYIWGFTNERNSSSLVAQRLKRLPAMWETRVRSLGGEDSPGEGNGNPLQYSCLENPMDGGAWGATVHGVAKSWTRLSDFTFTFTLMRGIKSIIPLT